MATLGIGFLAAVSFFLIVYFFLDFMAGDTAAEERKIQKRLRRLIKPEAPSITYNTKFSNIARLNKIFKRKRLLLKLYHLLDLNGWQMSVSVFLFSNILLIVISFYMSMKFTHSTPLAIMLAFFSAFIPFALLKLNRKKYVERFMAQFPQALTMMRNAIIAGQGVQAAFNIVAQEAPNPVNLEFGHIIQEIELGAKMEEALKGLYARIPTPDMHVFVTGILIQQGAGGNIGDLFQHIENSIRNRVSMARELNALTAQGKMAGMVMTLLPLAVALMMNLAKPGYINPLLEPANRPILYGALISLAIGGLVINKMTKISIAN